MRKIKAAFKESNGGDHSADRVVSLRPAGPSKGSVLFSYIIDGFLTDDKTEIPNTHTNIWQSVLMAQTFVDLGFEVDVIHYTNQRFAPQKTYAYFVDVRHNMARLSSILGGECVKIMHLDTAHILFHNAAEANRLLDLQKRRGITLRPRRFELPNLGIEHADYATTCGNDFTVGTFGYAKKKIFKLPSPCGISLERPQKKWDSCRKNFLWFSSSGCIHKGLDLALEAFKEMPDFHLTICGPLEKDKDFVNAYHAELFETENIQSVGWVDIGGPTFRELTNSCAAMLHLSCSEGGAPSVKMCMHAGLIPIVSYESGVDVMDFGYVLRDCSIDNIKEIVSRVAQLPADTLEEKGGNAWEYARRTHTRENFEIEFRKVVLSIIADSAGKKQR